MISSVCVNSFCICTSVKESVVIGRMGKVADVNLETKACMFCFREMEKQNEIPPD